jgi:hypothetical protein
VDGLLGSQQHGAPIHRRLECDALLCDVSQMQQRHLQGMYAKTEFEKAGQTLQLIENDVVSRILHVDALKMIGTSVPSIFEAVALISCTLTTHSSYVHCATRLQHMYDYAQLTGAHRRPSEHASRRPLRHGGIPTYGDTDT